MTAQKRDEAFANYKAMEAQVKAAQSQYDMAVNGARMEEKKAAAARPLNEEELNASLGMLAGKWSGGNGKLF